MHSAFLVRTLRDDQHDTDKLRVAISAEGQPDTETSVRHWMYSRSWKYNSNTIGIYVSHLSIYIHLDYNSSHI